MPLISGNNDANFLIGSSQLDLIIGFGGDDTIFGMSGDDEILGGDGNDTMTGGFGADRLDGGAGIDTASYGGSFAGVSIDLASGIGIGGEAQGDVLVGVENAGGSFYDDYLAGDGAANALTGHQGNDLLYGRDGDDTLDGSNGIDHLDGGNGIDTVTYASYFRGIGVNLGLDSGGDGDTLSSIENAIGSGFDDFLFGGAYGNRLEGLGGGDRMNGLGGNDTLIGGDGIDQLDGGEGNDMLMPGAGLNWIDGGDGSDTLNYVDFGQGVSVSLFGGDTFAGGQPKDSFINIENFFGSHFADNIKGDDARNVLRGLNGDDEIAGFGGADVLVGGRGADILVGGADADRFDFDNLADSRGAAVDRIADFDFNDVIDLSTIDARSGTPGNQAFAFIGQANFTGVAGQLRFAFINGGADTAVTADVNGDFTADFQITLTGLNFLSGGNFIL